MAFNFGAFVGGMAAGVTKKINEEREERIDTEAFKRDQDAFDRQSSITRRNAKQDQIDLLTDTLLSQGFNQEQIETYGGTNGKPTIGGMTNLVTNAHTFTANGLSGVMAITNGLDSTLVPQPVFSSAVSYVPPTERKDITDGQYATRLTRNLIEAKIPQEVAEAQRQIDLYNKTKKDSDSGGNFEAFTSAERLANIKLGRISALKSVQVGLGLDGQIAAEFSGQTMLLNVAEALAAKNLQLTFGQRMSVDTEFKNQTSIMLSNAMDVMREEALNLSRENFAYKQDNTKTKPDKFHFANSLADAQKPSFKSTLAIGDVVEFTDPTDPSLSQHMVYTGRDISNTDNPNDFSIPFIIIR